MARIRFLGQTGGKMVPGDGDVRNRGNMQRLTGALLKLAVGALALLPVLACSNSAGSPAPSPTPQSLQFPTSPAAANTSADDRPGSGHNNADSSDNPILYTAIWRDKTEAVGSLIGAGANVNAKTAEGRSLLSVARSRSTDEIVRILEGAGTVE